MCTAFIFKFVTVIRRNFTENSDLKAHSAIEPTFQDRYSFYKYSIDEQTENFRRQLSQGIGESVPNKKETSLKDIKTKGQDETEDEDEGIDEICEKFVYSEDQDQETIMQDTLRKPVCERNAEDLKLIYEEIWHIKALAHLSNSVKRELARVIVFESHADMGTTLFQQGDEGTSWYIILKGSVDVVIRGKGTVTVLREGDDFGDLALVNDSPRAATIVSREEDCQFLRVDKDDFKRILRDVEANTVRLQEHGQDVLVLETIPANKNTDINTTNSNPNLHVKYTVIAGCPSKMLEYLLETRLDRYSGEGTDLFLDDFLLTHIIFMPTEQLLSELSRHFGIMSSCQDREFFLACRRRVVQFVHRWIATIGDPVFEEQITHTFLQELYDEVDKEVSIFKTLLQDEINLLKEIRDLQKSFLDEKRCVGRQLWDLSTTCQPVNVLRLSDYSRSRSYARCNDGTLDVSRRGIMRANDDIIFRVYSIGHTFCTVRVPLNTTVESIKIIAAETCGLKPSEDMVLLELKSSGEKVNLKDRDMSVATSLSLNGRMFMSSKNHLQALTCLPEQERPSIESEPDLEGFSTRELAYYMTLLDWSLFHSVHEYELIYYICGRAHFNKITSNMDVFVRRFNEIQFWVASKICVTSNLDKRATLIRKFIKLATYYKEYQNINASLAVVMGLNNSAVSRLHQTWERIPSKTRKVFSELEALIEPSRNHRPYRLFLNKLTPPFIPFIPLILKDMTFIQDGNKTHSDQGLVNFDKMQMIAHTLRILRRARSSPLNIPPHSSTPLTLRQEKKLEALTENFRCIDNQLILNQLSQMLEPKTTQ